MSRHREKFPILAVLGIILAVSMIGSLVYFGPQMTGQVTGRVGVMAAPDSVVASISPASPLTTSTLLGYCNASDSDGDNLTYEWVWYRNGTEFSSGTANGESGSGIEWCYQETANVSTDCGGLSTGVYKEGTGTGTWNNVENIYDENWDSHSETAVGSVSYFINYTKPSSANSGIWQTKDSSGLNNITVPEECWNYSTTTLEMYIVSDAGGPITPNCLHPETEIITPSGLTKISELEAGDIVTSYDGKGKVNSRVKEVYRKNIDEAGGIYYIIKAGDKQIYATGSHEIYADGNYILVQDLELGQNLFESTLGEIKVDSIELVEGEGYVYQIEVENTHNYFAEGLLVHNINPPHATWYCYSSVTDNFLQVRDDTTDNFIYEEAMWWNTSSNTGYTQSTKVNVVNITSGNLDPGDEWTFSCRANDGGTTSSWANSSTVTIAPPVTATEYTGSTTNFGGYTQTQLESLDDVVLEVPAYGKIEWKNPVDVYGANFDSQVDITQNHVIVNSSILDSSLDSSANVTLYNIDYATPVPMRDGVLCEDCNIISWSAGTIVFSVPGFSEYTTTENSSLRTWDNNDNISLYDGNDRKYAGELVKFYANYTNSTDNTSITSATCNITYSDTGTFDMAYNATVDLYYHNRTMSRGDYSYTVSCDHTDFSNTLLIDPISITSTNSGLYCQIVPAADCAETAILYLENDTGGFRNAHAQNVSEASYAYVVCCDANLIGDTLDTTCDDATFLRLSSLSNAHVQQSQVGTYSVDACLSASIGDVSCSYGASCADSQTCLASMASSEGDQSTNAQLGDCSHYNTKICCGLASPPTVTASRIAPADVYDNDTMVGYCNATDGDGDNVTYYWEWYLNDGLNESGVTSSNYTQGVEVNVDNITSSYLDAGDNWTLSCLAYDGQFNSSWVNSSVEQIIQSNTAPTAPVLFRPENNNHTTHDRTPEFIWFNSTDAQGDTITYRIEVDDSDTFTTPIIEDTISEGGLWSNATNYTNSTILDVDTVYYWRVTACDAALCSDSIFNFTVESFAEITLLQPNVSFGNMLPHESNDTLDWAPAPIWAENTGNIVVDVNVTATDLFTLMPNPSAYFRYQIAENETGSYTSALDSGWVQLNQTTMQTSVTNLNWSDANDAFNIHFYVEVPDGEPPVSRQANITVTSG